MSKNSLDPQLNMKQGDYIKVLCQKSTKKKMKKGKDLYLETY